MKTQSKQIFTLSVEMDKNLQQPSRLF